MPLIKIIFTILLSLSALLLLSACKDNSIEETTTTTEEIILSTTQNVTVATTEATTENSTDEKIDTYIALEDDKTTINGKGVAFSDGTVTITEPGTYSLSGTLTDGKIFINTEDEDKKVKLYFNGVNIGCSTDAPIFIENSPKETVIILAEGSMNNLSDTERTVPTDSSDYATAVIYAKDDLQIEGKGTLNITGNFNKGIFSKNDIQIRGGTVNITAADDGIRGKDGVEISDGTINITCGGDGIRTSEVEEENRGDILLSGGTVNVTSDLDGIQAVGNLSITGGNINIVSGGGSTGTVTNSADMGFGGMGGPGGNRGDKGGSGNHGNIFDIIGSGDRNQPPDSSSEDAATETEASTKGIKATKDITISSADITISACDDAIHATNVTVDSGTFSLKSDDDGIHADKDTTINDGDINIDFSYEGIEGMTITFNGGSTVLTSADDGLNAASEDTSETSADTDPYSFGMGGRGGMGGMEYTSSCQIYINGGYIRMDANGDGVDSNGDVTMKDGTLIVYGPTNSGNGALDYAGTFRMNGGLLLAVGASGMAQSVTADGDVQVLGFNCYREANALTVITDEKDNNIIGFKVPKAYSNVIFASDKVDTSKTYSVYDGGSFSSESSDGIYLDGTYTKGELLGTLSRTR